jgi:septum formation protein
MENSKLKFILASASPRRKELIEHLKIPFGILALNVPEETDFVDPVRYSDDIARLKVEAVVKKLSLEKPRTSFFVVAADTIVCLDGKIFGKPKDRNEAREILEKLSGKTHSVFTAVAVRLIIKDQIFPMSFVEESKVTFNTIHHTLMERYLASGDSLDKAGAYGIQGPSLTFVSKVEGDYSNIVGFPLSRFITESDLFLKSFFTYGDLWLNLF